MNKYEEFITKSDECSKKAIEYYQNGDFMMAIFFKNASIGFKQKALNVMVE